ncbi:MAG TPA: VOC family protein [Chloroflexota bacterium]|nr:VOC family protein [Chloroflexota bacterium]
MIERIDHIAIAVHAIDASLPYYRNELRLVLVHDEVLPEVGVRLAYLDAGNSMLQLVEPLAAGPVATFLAEHGEGLHHICFAVEAIPDVLQRLTGETEARLFMGGRQRRCAFLVHRPNGLLTELTETRPSAALVASLAEGARE